MEGDEHFHRYRDAIYILLNTGLRISEFCGLTVEDLDFKNGSIRVNKQLQRTSNMRYYIERPKTESGIRYVPHDSSRDRVFQEYPCATSKAFE